MFIKIATGKDAKPIEISKKQLIHELKDLISTEFGIDREKQKLFFSGKLLEDNTPIYKYNIKDGYVVQVIESCGIAPEKAKTEKSHKAKKNSTTEEVSLSEYYKVGEAIEFQETDGSWTEAEIVEIYQSANKENADENKPVEPLPMYKVCFKNGDDKIEKDLKLEEFRPRSVYPFDLGNLKIRQIFHVNYNIGQPQAWGKWYDFYVDEINRRKKLSVCGHLILHNGQKKENVTLDIQAFENSIFSTKNHIKISDRDKNFDIGAKPIFCSYCEHNRNLRCRDCGCSICGGRNDPDKTIVCDECLGGFHIYCLKPPLKSIPEEDDWYCSECKNENEFVKVGETVKTKRGFVADKSKSKRDWGRGMATAARTTTNTIVPATHFGSIPGVEVGTTWRYRMQVAESGVHRPHVAGIAGRKDVGAFSIVLAGGYEDDKDDGDEVLYTGSGGRDLSNNKRVSNQSCDQELTRMNLALAVNCNGKIDDKKGAESDDWKAGKPVRVVRSYKEKSEYAPKEGFRYDGLYKIVKYFPKKGKSGFKVWQFLLRRDDPTPAPWTEEGKKHIQAHGLEDVIYPENYAEKNKRNGDGSDEEAVPKKRSKIEEFKLGDLSEVVEKDELNKVKWGEVNEFLKEGKIKYLEELKNAFECVCCQDLVHKPVTTICKHNFCLSCFRNAKKVMGLVCPLCKSEYTDMPKVNENLEKILLTLYPGYEVGR
ncbi:hypothetical protein RUM43_010140 [Polyplax serrata]|uniref:RING-type E3 ubiquitin transferase n=1 Tax=Polyplax serrata TaxID=468196 RepID=A0AAN8P735_POLSC